MLSMTTSSDVSTFRALLRTKEFEKDNNGGQKWGDAHSQSFGLSIGLGRGLKLRSSYLKRHYSLTLGFSAI